jgi:uncharacterized protein (TIGR03083 family)
MAGGAKMTPATFFANFAGAGFSFSKFAEESIARNLGSSPQETLEGLQAAAHNTTSPPGPGAAWIGEAVIHAEDIRRPLGISHTYNMAALRQSAGLFVNTNALIGSKKRIDGVRLEATDTDWAFGQGPTVRGPMLAILMAMTGRKVYLEQLSGDGVGVLRARL